MRGPGNQWQTLMEGWVKINIDGASVGNSGMARIKGVVRDSAGLWIRGFKAVDRLGFSANSRIMGDIPRPNASLETGMASSRA
ncbi:hypothetical protein ACSBR2_006409 [Camellia fascicularis]